MEAAAVAAGNDLQAAVGLPDHDEVDLQAVMLTAMLKPEFAMWVDFGRGFSSSLLRNQSPMQCAADVTVTPPLSSIPSSQCCRECLLREQVPPLGCLDGWDFAR